MTDFIDPAELALDAEIERRMARASLVVVADVRADSIGEYDGNPERYEATVHGTEQYSDAEVEGFIYDEARLCCCHVSEIDRRYTPDGSEYAVVRYWA